MENPQYIVNDMVMTLLTDYAGQDVRGWLMSEKYHGCRAYWDGARFWTRNGLVVKAPAWFCEGLPDTHLDGEIWAGYGNFQTSRKAVQYGHFTPEVRFIIFDAPRASGTWDERMRSIRILAPFPHAEIIGYQPIRSRNALHSALREVLDRGGEGLVMRSPEAIGYEAGRSRNALRIKKMEKLI